MASSASAGGTISIIRCCISTIVMDVQREELRSRPTAAAATRAGRRLSARLLLSAASLRGDRARASPSVQKHALLHARRRAALSRFGAEPSKGVGWQADGGRAAGRTEGAKHLVVEDGDGGGVMEEVGIQQALRR